MRTLLWLDDQRDPHREFPPVDMNIVWVKSYEEFCDYLKHNPMPEMVDFDHDLSPEQYAPQEHWVGTYRKWRQENPYTSRTGRDCAMFLCYMCCKLKRQLPQWQIHSHNPIGAYEITEVLMAYAELYYDNHKQDT